MGVGQFVKKKTRTATNAEKHGGRGAMGEKNLDQVLSTIHLDF